MPQQPCSTRNRLVVQGKNCLVTKNLFGNFFWQSVYCVLLVFFASAKRLEARAAELTRLFSKHASIEDYGLVVDQ